MRLLWVKALNLPKSSLQWRISSLLTNWLKRLNNSLALILLSNLLTSAQSMALVISSPMVCTVFYSMTALRLWLFHPITSTSAILRELKVPLSQPTNQLQQVQQLLNMFNISTFMTILLRSTRKSFCCNISRAILRVTPSSSRLLLLLPRRMHLRFLRSTSKA
jgi:hypothetical protein